MNIEKMKMVFMRLKVLMVLMSSVLLAFLSLPSLAQSFTDVSYLSKAVSTSGDAIVSTDASAPGGFSGRFDGNGDYLTVAPTPIKGTSAVGTLESWIYITSVPAYGWPLVSQSANATGGDQVFMVTGSANGVAQGKLRFYRGAAVGSAIDMVGATTVPLNQWVHVAVSFDGTTARLFVNGALDATATTTLAWKETDQPYYIGRSVIPVVSQNQSYANGRISNLRVTPGVARYTSAFTAAASLPLLSNVNDPYASSVVLYLDSAHQKGAFVDQSPTPKAVTLVGTPKTLSFPTLINGAVPNFGGSFAANYLSGTDGITVAKSNDFVLGTGDFTIELWARTDRLQAWDTLVQIGDWWATDALTVVQGSGIVKVGICNVDTGAITLPATVNQWYHFAVTRANGNMIVYLNGTQVWTGARALSVNPSNTYGVSVGTSTSSVVGPFKGYMDKVRITKGVARLPADMLLPKREFGNQTLVDGKDPYSANVSLLLVTPEANSMPRVLGLVTNKNVDNSVGSIDVNFSSAIDATSISNTTIKLTNAQQQVLLPSSIAAISASVYRLNFSSPIADGNYTLNAGPAIYGANHMPLDQNQNGVGGEAADVFTQTFSVTTTIQKVTLTKASIAVDVTGNLTFSLPLADATVSKFRLYMSTTPFTSTTQATMASEVSSSATSISLSNLSPNTIYYFAVVAVSPSGLMTTTVTPISYSNFIGDSVAYTYNTKGQVLTEDGPRTDVVDVTTNTYDASGNKTRSTNAIGQSVVYNTYDAMGRLLSVTDINGITTLLTYSDRGWLLTSKVTHPTTATLDSLTSYTYDALGLLTSMTMPNGTVLSYEYDGARRLVAIQNAVGERLEYTLDAAGNKTAQRVKNSQGTILFSVAKAFDELSRLMKVTGNHSQINRVQYDTNDNPVSSTDGLQRQSQQVYDALNRVVKTIDPALKQTQYTYDASDRLRQVTDARGNTTTYTYDGFGHLISLSSPDTGVSTFAYDAAGNRTSARDSRGVQVNYQYDALNRLTSVSYPATPSNNVTYSYDAVAPSNFGAGHLTSVISSSVRIDYQYNHLGLVSAKTTTIGSLQKTISYAYDLGGVLRSVTYPTGRVVNYNRDTVGRIQSITTQANSSATSQTVVDTLAYLPFGPLASYRYGNGLTHTNTYDSDYRLTAIAVGGINSSSLLSRNYGYDVVDNITSIGDGLNTTASQTFGYDLVDRLTSATGSYGSLTYTYDAVGNRLSEKQGTITATYTYPTTSNRLVSIVNGSLTRNFTYDAAGNRVQGTNESSQTHQYTYNAANRLSSVSLVGGPVTSYVYNALGQRVSKVLGAQTEYYYYDESGQLLSVLDGNGNVVREYIYNNDSLVGFIANGSTYYVHNDHHNAPQVVTNQSQAVVFMANYQPFGKVALGQSNSIEIYSRFPGQSLDSETGLYYNYFRDYDPSIGRYIESDPIGLDGGINTYAYVEGNPISKIDPTGQMVWVLPALCVGGGCEALANLIGIGALTVWSKSWEKPKPSPKNDAQAGECPGTPSGDPDCDKLNKRVQDTKKPIQDFGKGQASCQKGMSRFQLMQRKDAWLNHAEARSQSIQRCWNGGDAGHQQQTADAWDHVSRCDGLLK